MDSIMKFFYLNAPYIVGGYAIFFCVVVLTLRNRSKSRITKKQYKLEQSKILDKMFEMNMCSAKAFTYVLVAIAAFMTLLFSITPDKNDLNPTSYQSKVVISDTAKNTVYVPNDKEDEDLREDMAQGSLAMLTFFVSFIEACHNGSNTVKLKKEIEKYEKK